jgi:hypothetical protein
MPPRRWTLADIPNIPSPPQLLDPYLPPKGVTLIYGTGGVGKGFVSLYFAKQLVRMHFHVAILDYEDHEEEWRGRAEAMGFTDADLHMVTYYSPFGDRWPSDLKRGSLVRVAGPLRTEFDDPDSYVDYVVVDSFATATEASESMGGQRDALDLFKGLKVLGRPALVIAHVSGASEKFPAKPFGSVQVHNQARMTWAVAQVTDQHDETDGDYLTEGPSSMALELRNMKRSGGSKFPPQFLNFKFDGDRVTVDVHRPVGRSLADLSYDAITRAQESLTVAEIHKAIKVNEGRSTTDEAIRKALKRDTRFILVTGKKGMQKWAAK